MGEMGEEGAKCKKKKIVCYHKRYKPGSLFHSQFVQDCPGLLFLVHPNKCSKLVRVHSCFSRGRLFATPWAVACQAPLSVGFPRQQYWSGVAIPFSRGSSGPRDQTCIS